MTGYPWRTGDALLANDLNAAIAFGLSATQTLVADTAPAGALPNVLWWDSAGTGLYINYNDGTSTQWVATNNQNTLMDAPSDSNVYARENGAWVTVTSGSNGGPFLPLAGGTVSGITTFSATTTHTGNATFNGGLLTVGQIAGSFNGIQGSTNLNVYVGSTSSFFVRGPNGILAAVVDGTGGVAASDYVKLNSFASGPPSITTNSGTNGLNINPGTGQLQVTGSGELVVNRVNLGAANGAGYSIPIAITSGGAIGHLLAPIWENTYWTGTNSSGGNQNFNTILVNDNVTMTGGGQSNALFIKQYAQANASRMGGLWVDVSQSAAPVGNFGFSTALTAAAQINYNCGGTAFTSVATTKGACTTLNTYTTLTSGATFLNGMVGYEMDISASSGCSFGQKTGLLIARLAGDVVSGAWGSDTAISIAGPAPAAGWDVGLAFGSPAGQIPYKSSATLIAAFEPQTPSFQALANWGIDFAGVVFSNGFARSLGFLVDGFGNVTGQRHNASNWSLTPSSTGLAVDVVGQRASLTSIVAGGGGWSVGDKAITANGGVYQVTAVSGSAATTVVQLVPDVAVSPPANPVTTTPTNVSMFHSNASGLTLNLAWTGASGLSLNPTGQHIGFNGTAPIAKPTVSGAKGSNAALASLMTALAAYGLVVDTTTA